MPEKEPIDLVYLWCDAADEKWRAKKDAVARAHGIEAGNAANASYRFVANDELKYSLRSAEKYVPWVRNVVLMVDDDNTPPAWLRLDHPRLRIVRLSEFMPPERLPCYCSPTIEHHMARIPCLSGRFIYANDDMMFARPLGPEFFFAADGYPICRFAGRRHALDWIPQNAYHAQIKRAADAILAAYPDVRGDLLEALERLPHHAADSYRKSDMLECFGKYEAAITDTMGSPFRSPQNVQRIIYLYEAIATGRGHYRLARRSASGGRLGWLRNLFHPPYADSLQFVRDKWRSGPSVIEKMKPGLFCFNDTVGITDDDRRWLHGEYERLFPCRSTFEK